MPYLIGSGFTESQVGLIREAVAEYNRVFEGCVQWTERSGIEVSGFAGSVPVFLGEFKENFFGENELFWRLHRKLFIVLIFGKSLSPSPHFSLFRGKRQTRFGFQRTNQEKTHTM